MLEFIKISEENKSNQEYIESMNYCNSIIKELLTIDNKINSNLYSKDFSFSLNKYEDDIKNNNIIVSKDKKLLLNYINNIFDKLNKLKELEHKKNSDIIAKEVDKAVDISKNHENFKEAKKLLIDIQKIFENKYIHPESHEYLWSVLQDSFARLKKREKLFFSEQKKIWTQNYNDLYSSLEEVIKKIKEECNIFEIKSQLIKIQKKFKGIKLERNKQQELWDRLQDSFEKLKEFENIFIEKNKEAWENNLIETNKNIEKIELEINNKEYSRKLWDSLRNIQDSLKINPIGKENEKIVRKKIQLLFDTLKEKQRIRNEEIEKLKEGGFDKLDRLTNRALNEANTNKNLEDVFQKLKTWQKNIFDAFYISRDEKNILLEKINNSFEIYKKRKDEENKLKRKIWLEKQNKFLETITNKKNNLENTIIPKIEEEISKIEYQIQNSSDEEKENLNKFLEEKIKNKNELLEKIDELKKLIEEVAQSISKK